MFFNLLQSKRDAFCGIGSTSKILGYWCESHRYDQIASDVEKEIAYVADLLSFFRSVIARVMANDRTQGIRDYIASLLEIDGAATPGVAQSGSLSFVHFAPQRWLSTVKPL